jgi:hypothetical protein
MTPIGKLLSFLNLFVGLGILSWSVSVYSNRPAWFGEIPLPETVNAGQTPENFKQMKAEVEALTRTAAAASANWGAQRKILEAVEERRAERLKKYAERLAWAKTGNPKDESNGFYEPTYEKDGGLLDLATLGKPIKGSDNKPLKGSETLLNNFVLDVDEVARLESQIVAQRNAFVTIAAQIRQAEDKLLKMTDIREAVQGELFFLETFEVNVYETRETVLRRKKQLDLRLGQLAKNKGE